MHFVPLNLSVLELHNGPSEIFISVILKSDLIFVEGFNFMFKSVCSFFFFYRNVECLNLLLSSGTDLNKRDIMGR